MCVLVKDAGESVLSPDVEVIHSARICDRLRSWSWAQWRCTVQGTVRGVLVVERFELAHGMQEMSQIPDQGAVQELAPAVLGEAERRTAQRTLGSPAHSLIVAVDQGGPVSDAC